MPVDEEGTTGEPPSSATTSDENGETGEEEESGSTEDERADGEVPDESNKTAATEGTSSTEDVGTARGGFQRAMNRRRRTAGSVPDEEEESPSEESAPADEETRGPLLRTNIEVRDEKEDGAAAEWEGKSASAQIAGGSTEGDAPANSISAQPLTDAVAADGNVKEPAEEGGAVSEDGEAAGGGGQAPGSATDRPGTSTGGGESAAGGSEPAEDRAGGDGPKNTVAVEGSREPADGKTAAGSAEDGTPAKGSDDAATALLKKAFPVTDEAVENEKHQTVEGQGTIMGQLVQLMYSKTNAFLYLPIRVLS